MTSTLNQKQKSIIQTLRAENYSYAKIAETLGLNLNTVKSICLREGYYPKENIPRKTKEEKAQLAICKNCGKPLKNDWNRVGKQFCGRKCRTKYWNEHHPRGGSAETAFAVPPGSVRDGPKSGESPGQGSTATPPEPALLPERPQNDPGLFAQGELSSEVKGGKSLWK